MEYAQNAKSHHNELPPISLPSATQTALGAIFVVLLCFGLTFNSAVIHTFRREVHLQTPTNVLVIGFVLCDLMINVFAMPFIVAACFGGEWIFGEAWCQGYGFVMTLLVVTSICIMTGVALDRFFIVTRTTFGKKITTFKALMTILSCFGYGLLWATFPLVGWGGYVVDSSGLACGPDWTSDNMSQRSYNITMVVLVFFVPCIVITYCYIKIIVNMTNNRVEAEDASIFNSRADQLREIRLAFAIFMVTTAFVLSWLPYMALSIWSMFNDITKVSQAVRLFAPLLAKSASVWNALIYVVNNKDFREALYQLLFKQMIRTTRLRGAQQQNEGEVRAVQQKTDKLQHIESKKVLDDNIMSVHRPVELTDECGKLEAHASVNVAVTFKTSRN